MSSRTSTECVELALDDGADEERRAGAIRELKTANECDELAALARTERIADRYRRQALEALATSQCDSALRGLVEEEDLEESLQQTATELLATVDGD
ncbi:hypothetical protein C477_18815 [Haloterrigena salina JCM 13891]|uniref:Uncharacterized protein n=1 Tax=Haloterrigena salina JCM 13891 TaxID=1227488 RepID=M0BYU4_9EURY|nr:hypothetical protein [Haloterrigena salina]ELZ15267.1 hypothetical protein C477_18815 [Haloterrigena salina JCM 13891]